MNDKPSDESADLDLLRDWMNGVGGGISVGNTKLKSVKISKSGDKITIVLRKQKEKKKADAST